MEIVRVVRLGGREYRVRLASLAAGSSVVVEGGEEGPRQFAVGMAADGGLLLDGVPVEARVARAGGRAVALEARGESWPLEVLGEAEAALARECGRLGVGSGTASVRAPMPGRVLAVEVEEGGRVEEGAALFIIEAMKMENEVRAPRGGVVRNLRVAPGAAVEGDEELCELVAADGAGGEPADGSGTAEA